MQQTPNPSPPVQATLTWKWCQWLCQKARTAGKVPLLLNLDETAVPLEYTHTRGNIVIRESGKRIKNMPKQLANRSACRCFFTHVAIICNDPEVQALLPQVLFFASRHLSWQNWTELQAALPKNIFLRRQVSGWNNKEQHSVILKMLKRILEPVLPTMQPILSFDAAPLHLHPEVIELLGELDIWWLLVPKKLTWLLQPLDTHAFSKYKRYMRNRWLDTIVAQEGRRNIKDAVLILISTIQTILEGSSWRTAFDANGLAEDTGSVSKYIKDQLEWPVLPAIVAGPPTEEDLIAAWPVSRRVPLREIFLSLGLDPPEHLALPLGGAEDESFLVPVDDGDDCPLEAFEGGDTDIPPVPCSPDDLPLSALAEGS